MERRSVETIVQALNAAGVRYLVAGGLAVVAHGFVRFTADVDLLLDLAPDNVRRALEVFTSLGYRPRAPVALDEFAQPEAREKWAREKALTVFSLASPERPATEIDLFVESPIDFDQAYARRASLDVAPGVPASFVGLEDLIRMKRQASRPLDLDDVAQLERVTRKPENP